MFDIGFAYMIFSSESIRFIPISHKLELSLLKELSSTNSRYDLLPVNKLSVRKFTHTLFSSTTHSKLSKKKFLNNVLHEQQNAKNAL